MAVSTLQTALRNAGYDPGAIDEVIGAKTYAALIGYAVQRTFSTLFTTLGSAMAHSFPAYMIDRPLRIAHWLGQAAHETAGFRRLTELGCETDFARYDGRLDLGNIRPGDGALFRGRGLFQITGRANYARYGRELDLDLLDHPDVAAEPNVAVQTACLFWTDHGLNGLADADDCRGITEKINGGQNGYADRLALTSRIKALWS